MLVLTHSLIETGTKTKTCDGINKAQCILLGIEWPPRKGWKQSLVGTEISESRYEKFFAVRGKKGGDNPGLYEDIVGKEASKSKKRSKNRRRRQSKREREPGNHQLNVNPQYSEGYYKTPLWARIRELVFIERGKYCWICGGGATLIHHQSYEEAVIRGEDRTKLYPLCNTCHRMVHFDKSGEKRKNWREYFDSLVTWEDETADKMLEGIIDRQRRRLVK